MSRPRAKARARRAAVVAALALGISCFPAARAGAICGNGVLDFGEVCDDGNTAGGDCCSTTCALEACSTAPQPLVRWQSLGPFDVGGRVTAVAVDPSDPDRILIGTPAAGIWRSADRGETWVAIAEWLDVAPVSAIAIDPGQPDRYLAGTGLLQDSGSVGDGVGTVRTSDAGAGWEFQADPTRTAYVADVLIWPGEPDRILLAGDRGLVLSVDGGSTLTEVQTGDSFTSVLEDPFDPAGVYASGRSGLYRSLDRGVTWSMVSAWPGVDTDENPGVATAPIAVSGQTPGLVRAAIQDLATFSDTDRIVLLESLDYGASWTELPAPPTLCPAKDRCGFANAIAIDPTSDARMLLGGDRLFRSEDGGLTWTPLASGVRGIHEIEIDSAGAVVVGRTGVAVLDAAWQTATPKNVGLPITQITSLDVRRDGSGALLAGTADGGTLLGEGDPFAWRVIFGMSEPSSEARFDPFDPDVLYAGLRRGEFSRSEDGGASWTAITSGLSPSQPAVDVAPLATNPLREGELFTGRLQLFRSANRGDLWGEHRPLGAPEVARIAPSPVIDDRLYFALRTGGTLFKTDGIHTDTFVLDPSLDARITSIYPDPSSENRVYVAMTNNASLRGSLWRTENFGVSWEDRSFGKLPAANDVVRDAFGALYVATAKGVYRSASEGHVWSPFSEGLPASWISKLLLDEGFVVAGTQGRGLFQLPVRPLVAIDTIPPGLRLLVDGVLQEGPFYADWASGSQHTIAPYLLQTDDTRQEFVGWTHGGSAEQVFTATGENEWPTAVVKVLHRLRLSGSPAAGGTLVAEPSSEDGFYPFTSFVRLVAVPAPDHRLGGWSGDVDSEGGGLAGTQMEGPRSVTAHFEPLQVTIRTDPPGLVIGVDGEPVTPPRTFQWPRSTLHPLDPPARIDLDPTDPMELAFDHWSDHLPRVHDFEMRSETFTADVTAHYLPVVERVTTPAGGVQRITTLGAQHSRRELALSVTSPSGEPPPAGVQILRSTGGSGVIHELALPAGAAATRIDTWVEGRTLEGKGGLTGDGRTRRTRLVMFNPGADEASVDLSLFASTGTLTAGGDDLLRIGPGRRKTVMLDEVLGLPRSYDGALAIEASQPLHVCVLGVTENLRFLDLTDPIVFHLFDESDLGATAPATQVLLATPDTEHVLVLMNPDPLVATGTVSLRDRNGSALEAEIDGTLGTSIPFSLAAGAHRVLRVRFVNGVPGTETVRHARAQVATHSGSPLRIRHLEERTIGTTRYGTSTLPRSLPVSRPVAEARLPVDLARRDTGLVLTNRSLSQASVTLTLTGGEGDVAGVWTLVVPSGQQRVQLVSELSPPPPPGFFGQLRSTAPSALDTTGFTRTMNARGEEILAGLPVLTAASPMADLAQRFPFAIDGDTFASEWWLVSSDGQPRVSELHFADDAGAERFLPMEAPATP